MSTRFLSSRVIDVGWPFVISGSLLVGATLLVPALDDVEEARWQRDAARTVEQRSLERLENYARYLDALQRQDPDLVGALVATQLRQSPAGREALTLPPPADADAVVFGDLEPPPATLPPRRRTGSALERWTTSGRIRPWLLALGSVCLLVGLLPAAAATEGRGDESQ